MAESPQQPIEDVLRAHAHRLMQIEGVAAVAQGERDDGTPCIVVLIAAGSGEVEAHVPGHLGGYPVVVEDGGPFEARTGNDR